MNYLTTKEAAVKWNITANRITILCKGGKIPGAIQIGSQWMIPGNAEKPRDGRTKEAKACSSIDDFRFPLYVNREADRYSPPLNDEELRIRKAQLDYYACRFDDAQKVFEDLSKKSENQSIKIMSLFYLCSLSVEAYGGENFVNFSGRLQLEFTKEFPHKKDMEVIQPWLYTIMVKLQSVSEHLHIDPLYAYSPSVQPLIAYLSIYHLAKNHAPKNMDLHLDIYEMLCPQFLQNGYYYEACELHFLLFLSYYVSMQKDAMLHHLKAALTLVKEHQFYIIAASYEAYYQDAFQIAYLDFPEAFVKLIRHYSEIISISIGKFSQAYNGSEIYLTLSKDDYQYLLYALQENSNKAVARALHISERTVASHYAVLYEKLGVNGKRELVELCEKSLFKK